jgi:predicted Fe-Mo cluster-binding NifX family protein
MRIAVSSNDFKTVCGHAGQTRHWLIFEGERGGVATEVERLELEPGNVFHHHKDANGPHPLETATALISRSAGEGFLRRMAKKGIDAKLTSERNAIKAVNDYLAGKLKPPPAPGLMSLFCKLRDLFSEH